MSHVIHRSLHRFCLLFQPAVKRIGNGNLMGMQTHFHARSKVFLTTTPVIMNDVIVPDFIL
jgi:hypothetical protein